ncbi:BMP family ABC transporter substrate-binding protein [Sphaerisporangium melleum]|uniref:BMP family ABC transporter substrate-binding protein n=1 Tax=Sphaerisporangium melleum TaxID=321316 RepID=A0A917QZ77_9ACTN|nr:BMP family ABC transporter substrate-binding protein [Sphaerisporangium melleum]GGK76758.1 BMP family ABC transporter substrate-binding protein [Sphaerisporangium melleum]GII71772.1 BMP family ABC transporter substrate-binding protein [Sphaerisporangium melleum]
MLRNHAGKLAATTAVSAMLMAVAACGGDSGSGGTDTASQGATAASSAPAAADAAKVGLAYDIGGRGDQSFNDAAAAGLEKAKAELKLGETKELEAGAGETGAQKEERLRLLAQSGYNPVIAVGFAYSEAIKKVAAEFPEVKFAIIDDAAQGPNISNLVFAENEGSFLVGAAAALKTKKDHIGFVGGVQVPLIKKFEAGYVRGAQSVKPDIKVDVKYLTQPPDFAGFNDPAKGKTAAQGMYDAGADIVYQAAGGSGGGVFEAAKDAKAWAIGVDSDQALTADASVRSVILTSMLKKVDVAVFDFLKSYVDGTVKAGPTTYDLKAGGVDFSTTGGQVDDIKNKLDEYKQKIIDGEIKVPSE